MELGWEEGAVVEADVRGDAVEGIGGAAEEDVEGEEVGGWEMPMGVCRRCRNGDVGLGEGGGNLRVVLVALWSCQLV